MDRRVESRTPLHTPIKGSDREGEALRVVTTIMGIMDPTEFVMEIVPFWYNFYVESSVPPRHTCTSVRCALDLAIVHDHSISLKNYRIS